MKSYSPPVLFQCFFIRACTSSRNPFACSNRRLAVLTGVNTSMRTIPGRLPDCLPSSQKIFQALWITTGMISTWVSIASLNGPFLNSHRRGGYAFPIWPSGNIIIDRPFRSWSSARLNALNAEILLCRSSGISMDLKNIPVTGLSSNWIFPIKEKSDGQSNTMAVMSRLDVWLAQIMQGFDQSIGVSNLKR